MTKVGFISLGCPKNLVDSEVMMGILAREGYELTPRADEAEVLVVNTCSFIEAAQKESVDAILEMAEHKKFGAAKKLIVAGCLVERYRDQILEQVPEVDAVVGTGEVERIIEAVEGDLRVLPAAPPAFLYHDLTPRVITTPRHAAYIKIAEGCDHPCTFCIIPQLRGKFRSRRFESVVREAENLAASGAREITLIGQDTTSYGEDLGLRDGLAKLLERLAGVEDLQWVRFLVCVSESRDAGVAGYAGGASASGKVYGYAVAARQPQCAGADEARVAWRCVFEIAGAHADDDSRRFAADFVHRGISRGDRGGLRGAVRFRARGETGLDGRVRIFGCGQRGKLWIGRESRSGDDHRAARPVDGDPEEDFAGESAGVPRAGRNGLGGRRIEG